MPHTFRRAFPIAGIGILIVVAAARAQTPVPAERQYLRPETVEGRALVAELVARSPTARALVDELDRSDVIVYVRFRILASSTIDGHIGLLSSVRGRRFLIIELACGRPRSTQLVTLAHELHHAIEIAHARSVVDAPTLAAYYSTIGRRADEGPYQIAYETDGARDTAARVRRELSAAARTSHDRH